MELVHDVWPDLLRQEYFEMGAQNLLLPLARALCASDFSERYQLPHFECWHWGLAGTIKFTAANHKARLVSVL